MKRNTFRMIALVAAFTAGLQAQAQDAKTPYPRMAPLDQYLMERDAEIALARSAGPDSISRDAEVMVLGRHGYETAVQGKNGFVCMVERSWAAPIDEPEFWNPKMRGPICFNAPAARYNVPVDIKKTESVLAGRSGAEMAEDLKTAFDKKELPPLEPGAMCYMMSKPSERPRRPLAAPPDVLRSANGRGSLGRKPRRLPDFGNEGHSRSIHFVPGPHRQVVGRHRGS